MHVLGLSCLQPSESSSTAEVSDADFLGEDKFTAEIESFAAELTSLLQGWTA